MERQFKGIFIPAEIWEASDLSWTEKIVLMEIDSFTAAGKDCFISDEYIGSLVGCSPRTARTIVSKLVRLGYVTKTRCDGRKRYLMSAIFAGQSGKNCRADRQNLPDTYNLFTNIDITERKESIKEKKFCKPTVDQVRAYCEERGNGIDPQHFVDYYEARGWKVGTSPMKDWQAAVRTWERRPSTRSRQGETIAEYYTRISKDLGL